MNIKGQGHSLTFVQGHSDPTFSSVFSSKTSRLIEAIFHMEPTWDGRMKVNTNGLCHMTKTAAMPIYAGEIPKEWSLANICLLFMKSDRSLACNYRPVSLTCVPCKLLEHIVCSNIMAQLDEYKLLSDRQHAFRKGHICETQLTTVINDWAKILDNRGQVDTFILVLKRHLIHPLMNSLKANCLPMELVARH